MIWKLESLVFLWDIIFTVTSVIFCWCVNWKLHFWTRVQLGYCFNVCRVWSATGWVIYANLIISTNSQRVGHEILIFTSSIRPEIYMNTETYWSIYEVCIFEREISKSVISTRHVISITVVGEGHVKKNSFFNRNDVKNSFKTI